MNTVDCEVWILVDADGDYVASHDSDKLADQYDEDIGGELCNGCRRVKVTIKVPLPEQVELVGVAPEQGTAELTAVQ